MPRKSWHSVNLGTGLRTPVDFFVSEKLGLLEAGKLALLIQLGTPISKRWLIYIQA